MFRLGGLGSQGHNTDYWTMSVTYYTAILLVVDIKLALSTKFWTNFYWLSIVISSLAAFVVYLYMTDDWEFTNTYRTFYILFSTPTFYMVTIGLGLFSFILDLCFKAFELNIRTSIKSYFRILISKHKEDQPDLFNNLEERSKDFFASRPKK